MARFAHAPILVGALALFAGSQAGCDRGKRTNKPDDDAATAVSATDAAPTSTLDAAISAASGDGDPPQADPTSGASNKTKIARYGDEESLRAVATKIQSSAVARTFPPSGDIVATLAAGTEVRKIARHDDFILVSFTDPANAQQTLAGWVSVHTVSVTSKETSSGW